jgi:hypothetical protein
MELTSFEFVGFSVVSNVWSFGLCYLHLTVLLSLSKSKILLVPLQTVAADSVSQPRSNPGDANMAVSIVTRKR